MKGPKGELSRALEGGVSAKVDADKVVLSRPGDEPADRARHGLYRSLVKGMVDGVSKGFEKRLEIVGVSYQAKLDGQDPDAPPRLLQPGGPRDPEGSHGRVPAADARASSRVTTSSSSDSSPPRSAAMRPPEPYKGKGVRYVGEVVVQKAGKSFVGGEK